jgi:methylmalonyl-CoA mutase N-terminal domain/subunit
VIEKYEAVRARRDREAVDRCLRDLTAAAATDTENLMPHLVRCSAAYATVGEMVAALKSVWGEYQEPVRL